MDVRSVIAGLAGALALTLATGCSDEDDADRYDGVALAYERERWVGDVEQIMGQLRRNVTALEVRAGTASPAEQREIRALLHATRDQLRELEARMEFAPALAANEWGAYRRDFDADLESVRARVETATNRLGQPSAAKRAAPARPTPDSG